MNAEKNTIFILSQYLGQRFMMNANLDAGCKCIKTICDVGLRPILSSYTVC